MKGFRNQVSKAIILTSIAIFSTAFTPKEILGIAFVMGMGVLLLFVTLHFRAFHFAFGYNLPNLLQLAAKSLASLCWLIVLLGFAQRTLNFPNRFLEYANEAVLPFYILHQTVIIVFGFYVLKTDVSLMAKYLIINVISFLLTVAIFELLVKRFGWFRFLFGM
jgi:hypothetical protein